MKKTPSESIVSTQQGHALYLRSIRRRIGLESPAVAFPAVLPTKVPVLWAANVKGIHELPMSSAELFPIQAGKEFDVPGLHIQTRNMDSGQYELCNFPPGICKDTIQSRGHVVNLKPPTITGSLKGSYGAEDDDAKNG
ncbi:hypothetical protein NM688_g2836 [Phlebia brevispora]|uniref:Uncharacterized protein n=1 Tax=Phlebia brevispora TaxID=194682 RepID=A0ACC1T7C8_9APHY|nr:hypothetical protein NM688_g2836 [Phlebia brevispora]